MNDPEHKFCRLQDSWRWSRVMLEHERQHISNAMATSAGFLSADEQEGLCHDLADIDGCLTQHKPRVEANRNGS